MDLGEKIKTARQKAGITQSALAARIGLSPQRISQYESNYRRPRPDLLARIAEEIGVPISFFSDDEYLDSSDSYTFIKNARKYLEETGSGENQTDIKQSYQRFYEENYRPTKKDVRDFASDTGLSIDYLLGIDFEIETKHCPPEISSYIHVDGFEQLDIALIISHILRFFHRDLKITECTLTDAEVIAELLLEHIETKNIIPLTWLITGVSSEIRNAALAVLNAGNQWQDNARKQINELAIYHKALSKGFMVRKILLADDGKEAFLVYDSDDIEDKYSAKIFQTLEKVEIYLETECQDACHPNNKKTSQDQNDPET